MNVNPAASEQGQPKATASLLLVDDEPNILSSLRRVLRSGSYQIHTAGSGEQGLEILSSERIDLVISDMRMPGMDGAQFLEQVAKRWPDTVRLLLTGYADLESTISAINKGSIYKYFSKPWEDNDLKLSVQHALEHKRLEQERDRLLALTQRQNEELKELNAGLENKVRERTSALRDAMEQLDIAHKALKNNYVTSVKIFSNLIDMRAGMVAGHSGRVAEQARTLARRMGMSDEQAEQVEFAGLLHDIGLIGVPDTLFEKAIDQMNEEERQQMMMHPSVGQGVLMSLEPLQEASRYILHHHEHCDGSGYPDRLKGADIPLGARILAVVSDYDAAQNGRLFSERLSPGEALEYVKQHSGTYYDPRVVDEFVAEHSQADSRKIDRVVVKLASNELRCGMVLAENLTTTDGILLLTKGYTLVDNLIFKIRELEENLGKKLDIRVLARRGGDRVSHHDR